ncbi:MFS transporter [Streptacidiphilus rugosus]|uniref:MFS transporter n=1 Tax=Streptacidiphilus rugosus TaxID=405783 RepID=UPI00068F4BFD|nr:MFS transporter [Streptacidiphilus rugosus]
MSYRALFAPRGAVGFSLAVLVARFPMGMFSLAATLLVTSLHRSYSLAGLGGAATLVAVAAAGPWQARLVDRYGQTRVSVPAVLLASLGGAGIVAALYGHAPVQVYLLACAVSGLGPNTGSLARARWARLHRGREAVLHTAYAYEGVADELCYILGPIAAMTLATGFSPLTAYLTASLLALTGILALATQRRTEPPPTRRAPDPAGAGRRAIPLIGGSGRPTVAGRGLGRLRRARPGGVPGGAHPAGGALRAEGMPALVVMLVAAGGVFGTMEITTIGFAQAHGHKAAASLVLSCYAFGSCLSGLAFGIWRPRGRPVVRLRWALAAMALTLAPLPFASSLPQLAAILLVAGLATAPTMSTSMGLVGELVPPEQLTEGFTWTTTGLLVGISAGTAAGGWLVDHAPPGTGYHVPAAAALLALACSVRLRSRVGLRQTAGEKLFVQ